MTKRTAVLPIALALTLAAACNDESDSNDSGDDSGAPAMDGDAAAMDESEPSTADAGESDNPLGDASSMESPSADIPVGLSDDCAAVYKAACLDGCIDTPAVDTDNQCTWATDNECQLCTTTLDTFNTALLDTCGWEDLPQSTGVCNE